MFLKKAPRKVGQLNKIDVNLEFQIRLANEITLRRTKDFYETFELINYDIFPVVS